MLNPKLVKHTQTIRRLLPKNFLSVFDHFVELALKGLIFLTLILASYQLGIKFLSLFVKHATKHVTLYALLGDAI